MCRHLFTPGLRANSHCSSIGKTKEKLKKENTKKSEKKRKNLSWKDVRILCLIVKHFNIFVWNKVTIFSSLPLWCPPQGLPYNWLVDLAVSSNGLSTTSVAWSGYNPLTQHLQSQLTYQVNRETTGTSSLCFLNEMPRNPYTFPLCDRPAPRFLST